jgi:hypothetical protein
MTIVEFLLARLNEDEAVANQAHGGLPVPRGLWSGPGQVPTMKKERLLAEVAAKRKIVANETAGRIMHRPVPWHGESWWSNGTHILTDEYGVVIASGSDADELMREHSDPVTDTPVLRILAEVYSDHPDYQESWHAGS